MKRLLFLWIDFIFYDLLSAVEFIVTFGEILN